MADFSTHYRVYGDPVFRRRRFAPTGRPVRPARTLCGDVVPIGVTRAFAVDVIVECPHCLILRDVILSQENRKPLTIRRVRALRRAIQARMKKPPR
jgi:hypothetical protein